MENGKLKMQTKKKRPISSEGRAIKSMLIYAELNQREFCKKYSIPENRLSDIIHLPEDSKLLLPLRAKVYKILQEVLANKAKKESV